MDPPGSQTRVLMRDEVLATWTATAMILGTVAPSVGAIGDAPLGFAFILMALIIQLWAIYSFWIDATYSNTALLVILVLLLFVYVYATRFLQT
jgi:hypothetical protein